MIVVLFALLFLFFAFGFSIWIAMGLACVIYILIQGQVSLTTVASYLVQGVDSPTLVAIPFFILAGELMNKSGITRKLADFAAYFVGGLRGGLAYVAIVVNFIMAGVSGSAVADATAVSSILLPTMRKQGYDKPIVGEIGAGRPILDAEVEELPCRGRQSFGLFGDDAIRQFPERVFVKHPPSPGKP